MLNKSHRNKIKIRSTKKKYKQRTKKNHKYGGQVTKERGAIGFVTTAFTGQFYADAPNIEEGKIHEIGFEIPDSDLIFNPNKDNYKFLEMADRDLTVDMERKLNKYELVGGIGAQYCKYMYLIRATNPDSGNTVLHYICNHRSVEMFQLVWPYYLILYNEKFPQLLIYYINKKNLFGKTPLDLLQSGAGPTLNLDYRSRWIEGTFGMIKNAALRALDIKKLGNTALRRLGNSSGGRVEFIERILKKFGGKKSSELENSLSKTGTGSSEGTGSTKSTSSMSTNSSISSNSDDGYENPRARSKDTHKQEWADRQDHRNLLHHTNEQNRSRYDRMDLIHKNPKSFSSPPSHGSSSSSHRPALSTRNT